MIRQVLFDHIRQVQILIPVVVAKVVAQTTQHRDRPFTLGNPQRLLAGRVIVTEVAQAHVEDVQPGGAAAIGVGSLFGVCHRAFLSLALQRHSCYNSSMKPRFGDTDHDPHVEEVHEAAQRVALAIDELTSTLQAEFIRAFTPVALAFAQFQVEAKKAFEGIDFGSLIHDSTEEPH